MVINIQNNRHKAVNAFNVDVIPRIGETVMYYIDGYSWTAKVIEVIHNYYTNQITIVVK